MVVLMFILSFKSNILKFQKVFPYLKSMAETARRPFRKSLERDCFKTAKFALSSKKKFKKFCKKEKNF